MKKLFIPFLLLTTLFQQCKTDKVTTTVTGSNLLDTQWRLTEMNGEPVITPDNEKVVHFILTKEGSESNVKGFAGCNSIGGSYILTGNKIKFTIISTKMMCDDAHMKIEDFFLKAMSSASAYQIDGGNLQLLDGDTALADFKATAIK
ncbi:MAG TPA: META domain-containing protein [Chryseolinea sp.]|nr:META domain-containing protein [Chryseolinea sp.]